MNAILSKEIKGMRMVKINWLRDVNYVQVALHNNINQLIYTKENGIQIKKIKVKSSPHNRVCYTR